MPLEMNKYVRLFLYFAKVVYISFMRLVKSWASMPSPGLETFVTPAVLVSGQIVTLLDGKGHL